VDSNSHSPNFRPSAAILDDLVPNRSRRGRLEVGRAEVVGLVDDDEDGAPLFAAGPEVLEHRKGDGQLLVVSGE